MHVAPFLIIFATGLEKIGMVLVPMLLIILLLSLVRALTIDVRTVENMAR